MINNEEYTNFVDSRTSPCSKDVQELSQRLVSLNSQDFQVSRLMTASIGLAGEVGEFDDILKKIFFQGKEITPEKREHLIKELGDIAWYFAQACLGLNVSMDEVLQLNYDKLSKRYEGGFSVENSENRKKGDI